MKVEILVSILIVLLILIAITAPTFATKQANLGIHPLNIFIVEIESAQNKINSDIAFNEENNNPQDNNTVYRYITNTTASKTTLDINVKEEVNSKEFSGITASFSVRPAP